MAVKRKGILPPPIYRTGGKAEHYAIEVLEAERELILERIKSARSEKAFSLVQRQQNIKAWSSLADQLQAGIFILKANGSAKTRSRINEILKDELIIDAAVKCFLDHPRPAPASGPAAPPPTPAPSQAPPAPPKPAPPITGRSAIASCKAFAKCGDRSYFYCRTKCKKRKDKACDLIQHYTRRKKAA